MSIQIARRGAVAARRHGIQPYPGWWYSTLQGIPLGDMGTDRWSGTSTANALNQQWNYWDNPGGSAVSAAAEGIPAQPSGDDTLIKWYKAAGGTNEYQKLTDFITSANWPNPRGYPPPTGTAPPDVSGRYITHLYIPSNRFTLNPSHGWVNFFEMKEDYQDASNVWHQDPAWQVMCMNYVTPGTNTICIWGGTHNYPTVTTNNYLFAPFMDRWLTWEQRVYQGSLDTSGHGGRVEWWSNGQLMDTIYESEQHIGPPVFAPDLAHTNSWLYVAGQYSSNQGTDYMGTDVTTYVGSSYMLPLSTV